jgi:hypothetical protein
VTRFQKAANDLHADWQTALVRDRHRRDQSVWAGIATLNGLPATMTIRRSQGSARRVRERMSRLLRLPRYLLCRYLKGSRPGLSADGDRDTYAKVAFAKLYDRKTPITAAEILNDRMVPF